MEIIIKTKYDYHPKNQHFLSCDGKNYNIALGYCEPDEITLVELGDKGRLKGKALVTYNKLKKG